jgi:putative membrane protein
MLKQFLLRWMVNFLGLWTAATLLSGISYQDHLRVLIWAALIFSIVNALVKPFIILLTLPVIVLTLGLFTLVVNAFMLYLVTFFYHRFQVTNFRTAVVAVLIVWVVNYLLDDVIDRRKTV